MINLRSSFFIFLCVLCCGAVNGLKAQSLTLQKLTCEYLDNPLGIDISEPSFNWIIAGNGRNKMQSAYELIVGTSYSELRAYKGNVWSTGKIQSSKSINVLYAGKPLQSFSRYYWRVRVYDEHGQASAWSKIAWFETAVLNGADWQAKWISDGSKAFEKEEDFYKDNPAPMFRKTFSMTKKIAAARLYITGLGYFEPYVNGKKVGDHFLDPGWTSFAKTIQYVTYDITDMLRTGDNVAGVMLGNGWYNPLPLRMWGTRNLRNVLAIGQPCVKAQIRVVYQDGSSETIITDESWQTMAGPVVRNNVYLGEHYDARREIDNWCRPGALSATAAKAVEVEGPAGKLVAQLQPSVKITSTLKPVAISEPKPGVYVFDMGQNFAGVARLSIQAPEGTKVVLRYGEDIYKDGTLNVMTSVAGQIKSANGGPGAPQVAWQEDSYITKGNGKEVWSPRFTFHGFRYIEVTGWPGKPTLDNIEGLRMSADVNSTGTFTSSNEMFNQLYKNIQWTFLSNLFSVQSDCPAREKFGYGGDMFCTSDAFNFSFGMANFYRKIIQDHEDDQRPKGGITETAPYMGIGDSGPGDLSGPLGFQIGFAYSIEQVYDFYGDKRIVQKHYPALQKQIRFLIDSAKDHLYYVDLSDHESLDAKPFALSASLFYYHHVKLMARFSSILGRTDDAENYKNLSDEIREAAVKKFFKHGDGTFDNATQSAQLFGLYHDLVSGKDKDAATAALLKAIHAKGGHLSTGIFGTKMLFDVLRRNNMNNVAYTIANQRDFPGWGYMIANGATTLWETWAISDNIFSKNHPMFGSVAEWFYRSLLGINAAAPGFSKIIIKPQPAGDLTSAAGSYMSVMGKIGSKWVNGPDEFKLEVEIPVNTSAAIWIPSKKQSVISEGTNKINRRDDMKLIKWEDGYTVISTGSGKYSFTVTK
jgi:alpha-L-rhamnosidase